MRRWLNRWRAWDPLLLWVAAIDVGATLLMINYLVGGHHSAALRAVVIVGWVAVVPAVTRKEVVRLRRRGTSV
jgi:hypothetical protein